MPTGMLQLIADVDGIYRRFGAPDRLYGDEGDRYDHWADLAARQGLRLVRSPVRHLGTERAAEVLAAMRAELEDKVEIHTHTAVAEVLTEGGSTPRRRTGRQSPVTSQASPTPRPAITATPMARVKNWGGSSGSAPPTERPTRAPW